MIATGVDIESTGIDFLSGHKIIEIAMVKYEIETQAMVDSFVMRFNPSLYINLCNCLILICSIQHQKQVNLW
ncbi:hypothetical protein ACUIG4_29545, partial [Raoultella ornithinolytica]